MKHHSSETTLSVVESDLPNQVRMFNSLGCDIGVWTFAEWQIAIAKGTIIIQIGDKFVMEA